MAVASGVVQHLLLCRADKDAVRTDDGSSPLLLATVEGYLEVVKILLEAGAQKLSSPTFVI